MTAAESSMFSDEFAILSHGFRTRTTSVGCREAIDRTFGDCRTSLAGDAPTYALEERDGSTTLSVDGDELVDNESPDKVFSLLAWQVMNGAVAGSPDKLIVHAGAAVSPSGGGVVFPAGSGSGKTTLTAGLIRAGYSYLSDEMAAFDPGSIRLLAVPRAMSIKPGTFEALEFPEPAISAEARRFVDGIWPLRPVDLGSRVAREPVALRAVIAPTYRPELPTMLEPISRAAGVAELATNAFNLQEFGGSRGVELLAEAVRGATCYRLSVGSLTEAVAAVRSVVDAAS